MRRISSARSKNFLSMMFIAPLLLYILCRRIAIGYVPEQIDAKTAAQAKALRNVCNGKQMRAAEKIGGKRIYACAEKGSVLSYVHAGI